MDSFLSDLRFSLRQLLAHRVFTVAAVLSLALGIGVNTAIFSFVNALFLRPMPVEEPGRLEALFVSDPNTPGMLPHSYLNFHDLEELVGDAFSGVAAYRSLDVNLAAGGTPEQVTAELASGHYFPLLGVDMAAGRAFGPETDDEPGGHPVAVLSHDFWQRRFGADPGVVGREIRVNDQSFTVVGVAAAGFRGVNLLLNPDLWLPMGMHRQVATGTLARFFDLRRGLMLWVFGRRAPGVGPAEAAQAARAAAEELERRFPDDNRGRGMETLPLTEARINPNRRGTYALAGRALLLVTGLVLLIACANVANLLLARAAGRRRELAVRLSLGAGRGRVVRQLLVEGLLLALAGGALGLVVGVLTRELLWTFRLSLVPPGLDVGLDPRVLLFTLGISLVTGVLFAVVPALQSVRTDLVSNLKEESAPAAAAGGRRWRLSEALIVLQVAFSLVALVGTGLFLRSLNSVYAMDPGFETRRLAMVSFNLGAQGYDQPRAEDFYRRAVERVEALPGVERAVVAERGLLSGGGVFRRVMVEGRTTDESEASLVRVDAVGPGYFQVSGVPVVDGRPLDRTDRAGGRRVAVVNRTMAQRLWPDASPLGRRLRYVGEEEPVEVVGVAADAKYVSPAEEPQLYMYVPMEQSFTPAATLLVRTAGDPEPLLPRLRRELQSLDAEVPLVNLTSIRAHLRSIPSGLRMAVVFLGTFAVLAVVLSVLGIFGVMEYSVSRRRRELTIRFALGAERRDVLALVVKRSMLVVGVGLVIGLVCAGFFAAWIRRFLVASTPADPLSFAAAVLLFVVVALLASLIPARRAASSDPATILRTRG